MDLTKFYSTKDRLSYHPRENVVLERLSLRRLIAYDDRFTTITNELVRLMGKFSKLPMKLHRAHSRGIFSARFVGNKIPPKLGRIKVLDLGVGDAIYESLIPDEISKRLEIYGVDISTKQLSRAKKYLKEARVADLNKESVPYGNNFFNMVIISELLEHVFYPDKVLEETIRVLKKGGYLILTYPNTGALQLRLSLLLAGSSPLLNFPKNKEHIRFFSKKDILLMVNRELKLVKYQGLSSFFFDKWNFPVPFKLITPRFLQVLGNKLLPSFALGNLMIFRK